MFLVRKASSYEGCVLFPNTSESHNGLLHCQSQALTTGTSGVSCCRHQSPNPDCRFIITSPVPTLATKKIFSGFQAPD